MTTHLRARAAQAGALLAVVAGVVVAAPSVALADPPEVEITNLPDEVAAGSTVNLQYRVANNNDDEGPVPVRITVDRGGMTCSQECGGVRTVDQDGATFVAALTAPNLGAGETRQFRIQVTAEVNGERPNGDRATITVKGPEAPQAVRRISGKVKDDNGKAVSGAVVGIEDGNGTRHQTTSAGNGNYSFSSDNTPIAPGTIKVGAAKDGFEPTSVQVEAQAGRAVTVSLIMRAVAATTAPTTPPTSAPPSTEASEEPAAAAPTAEETSAAPTPATEKAANNSDDGGSWLYLAIGGLLVAAGVGAIVLVFLRRKNGEPDDEPTTAAAAPPKPRFADDATRVTPAPMAGAPINPAAATMVTPRPSMSDAPTVLQRPVPAVDDEFPDPYGAPLPPQGAFGGAPHQSAQHQSAQQQSAQQRYDEPTGFYQGEDDYRDAGRQQGGEWGAPSGGLDNGGAYAPQSGGQYGGGQYGSAGYADQDGYDDRSGGGQYGAQQGGAQYAGPQQGGAQYGGAQHGDGQYGGVQHGGGQYGDGRYSDDQYGNEQYNNDQFADGPYGGGQYGAQQSGQYGAQPGGGQYGGAQQGGGQQGSGQQGSGQQRFDEPTGFFQPGDEDRYDDAGPGGRRPAHPSPRRSNEWDR